MNHAAATPALSVVIIGRNEGARLVRCLEAVHAMLPPPGAVEIIYVDSASTDGSPTRAAALGAVVHEVRPERPSAALGRNAGWRAARAPIILFLDGDTVLHPRFVANSLREFDDPRVAVVWGHRREIDPHGSVYNRVLDLDWVYAPGPSEFCGGDALMRRAVLEEIGGYDEGLIAGEEPELCRRMRDRGYVVLHVDRPMTGHDLAMTRWSQYWRRAVRAGHAYAEVSERFKATGLPLWADVVRRNRVHAAALLGLPLLGLAVGLLLRSPWPVVTALAVLGVLAVRTAWRMRWKTDDPLTLLLYGVHSHLQQIPILVGQIGFYRDRRAGRRRGLIEYKEVR